MAHDTNVVIDIFQQLRTLSESVSDEYINYEALPEYKNTEVLGIIPEHLRPWYLLADELAKEYELVTGEEQILKYNQNRTVQYLIYTAVITHFPQLEQYAMHFVGERWELIAVPATVEDIFDSVYSASVVPSTLQ